MTKVAIIRCEKNETKCPLTNCFKCLAEKKEGFTGYHDGMLAGVFTCRCPGDNVMELSRILKSKGAEVIHFCTCTFAKKTNDGWNASLNSFCENVDALIEQANKATGLPCVKGTAHLPKDYELKIWK
jgi:predicted metal-binding protein